MPRLSRSDPSVPGITRRRRGRGWSYTGPGGDPIRDPQTLARLNALVIPPAWRDVWICPWPTGHIQAVGTDAAGRRQYRYHDDWRLRRDAEKFDRILLIAEALPAIREQVRRDMADIVSTGLSRRQVLACAVRLLDIGFFRIGGDEYAEQNGSFGLATIRREHVHIERGGPDGDDHVVFSYRAKSGKHRTQSVADPDAVRIVARLLERDDPQQDLLAWYDDEHGAWVDVHSSDVNAYLAELSPDVPLTAKDFRTWSATVLAAVALAVSTSVGSSPTASKRAVSRCYQEVSAYLGNTPAVCRASYVHPRVVELYQGGVTIAAELTGIGDGTAAGRPSTQGPVEQAVLTMLRDPQAARRCGRARSARRLTA